jgi:hypothetical protein
VSAPFLPPPDPEDLLLELEARAAGLRQRQQRKARGGDEWRRGPDGVAAAEAAANLPALKVAVNDARLSLIGRPQPPEGLDAAGAAAVARALGTAHRSDPLSTCYDYRYYEATVQVRSERRANVPAVLLRAFSVADGSVSDGLPEHILPSLPPPCPWGGVAGVLSVRL